MSTYAIVSFSMSVTQSSSPLPLNPLHAIDMPDPVPTKQQILLRTLELIGGTLVTFSIAVLLIQSFILAPARVNGRSMEPTYVDEELFFVNKLVYLFHPPERNDRVQVIDRTSTQFLIKRVIGVPGDTVFIKEGKVFIKQHNDTEPREINERSYLSQEVRTLIAGVSSTRTWIMAENTYFILGDNRLHSTDSRTYGPVPRSSIIGRVMDVRKKQPLKQSLARP